MVLVTLRILGRVLHILGVGGFYSGVAIHLILHIGSRTADIFPKSLHGIASREKEGGGKKGQKREKQGAFHMGKIFTSIFPPCHLIFARRV